MSQANSRTAGVPPAPTTAIITKSQTQRRTPPSDLGIPRFTRARETNGRSQYGFCPFGRNTEIDDFNDPLPNHLKDQFRLRQTTATRVTFFAVVIDSKLGQLRQNPNQIVAASIVAF